ncbi:probable disease resistance protein At5g66900 isoform X1 [Eucalyptus grandis]|uniref:probable disease resistance protein At5g66900 isoform X1 n=1 Tax=Eucalyptus grandis TaxID=71139 RepID=UPI00192EFBA9|nr:probable disease resistance protein At5g66900 isoform X1 [Eucalyptus grandis]
MKKESVMPVDFAEAVLQTAFSELFSLVKDVARTGAAFGPQIKKIKSTLSKIDPIITEIHEYNKRLYCPKELGAIKDLMDEGKRLVNKCLRIHPINLCKKYMYLNRLTEFDAKVLREFQIYIQLLDARNNGDILWEIREVKELTACGSSLQSGLGAWGNLAAPEAPDFIVGSKVEESFRKIKEQLLEEGVSVILVTAPPGCGKTILVKKLCHDVDIEGKFRNIMFVPVKKPNLRDIVQKMIQHNGFAVPMIETEDDAVQYLQLLLQKIGQNPVLLVLDNVWTESQSFLDKFKFSKIKDYKIVVTSRYEFPDYRPVHHLNPLTHGDALELLRRTVTVDDSSMDPPDEKLLGQIVKSCKGLPWALTVIAKSLQGKDRSFWIEKLNAWSEGHSRLSTDIDILNCLKKHLDNLDGDPSIMERFMDLSSFPEDCKIPATALTDMWVELYKLDFDGVHAIADLHDLVYRNLADLVVTRRNSSDDDDKSYSSHYAMQYGLLRELAIMECNQGEVEKRERLILELTENCFPDWWSRQKQQPLGARLVSISTDGTFSTPWPNLELPEAEALVLNFVIDMQTKTYALPEFIEKADKLKALIVTNYSFFSAKLGNLHVIGSNLRRIRLERIIVSLPSMGNLHLHSLQKISFCMCKINQVSTLNDAKYLDAMPNLLELEIEYCDNLVTLSDGIYKIKSLRKLSIANCHNFSILPQQIGQLASLEVVRLNSHGTCRNYRTLLEAFKT